MSITQSMIQLTDRVALELKKPNADGVSEIVYARVDDEHFELTWGDLGIEVSVYNGDDSGEQLVGLDRRALRLVLELQERLEQWYFAWHIAEHGEASRFHPHYNSPERIAEREAQRAASYQLWRGGGKAKPAR